MMQMQRSNKIGKIINARINGQDLTPDLQQVNTVVRNLDMEPIRTLTLQIIGTSLTLFLLYIIIKLVHHFRFKLGRRFRWLMFLPLIGNYFIKRKHSYVFVPPRLVRNPTLAPRIQHESNKINQALDSSDEVDSDEIDLTFNTTDLSISFDRMIHKQMQQNDETGMMVSLLQNTI
jgi:hypothetical protein